MNIQWSVPVSLFSCFIQYPRKSKRCLTNFTGLLFIPSSTITSCTPDHSISSNSLVHSLLRNMSQFVQYMSHQCTLASINMSCVLVIIAVILTEHYYVSVYDWVNITRWLNRPIVSYAEEATGPGYELCGGKPCSHFIQP